MGYVRSLLVLFLFSSPFSLRGELVWHTDYSQVQEIAQKNAKPILLFFNGSDWSGWAMKMKYEVLDSASFQEQVDKEFVCMEVDFPLHTSLAEKTKQQNFELKQRFGVKETPSVLIIDGTERIIAQINYLPESGEQLVEDIFRMVNQDRKLNEGLSHLTQDVTQLRQLYQLAQELRREEAIERILTKGLETDDLFFFTERYRLLVEQGKIADREALEVRQKLVALDPLNEKGTHFTVALIEFQERSRRSSPSEAVEPLKNYLQTFGSQDCENVWRIEMMIAQHYLDANAWEDALKHAQRAYDSAPDAMHSEIAHSLDYIMSRSTEIAQKD